MASEKQFEERLAAAEHNAKAARTDASSALVLAKGADKDVSEFSTKLNAQTQIIQAIRTTQVEHSHKFQKIDARFIGMDARFISLEGKLNSVEGRLRGVETRLDHVDNRLDGLDGRFERLETEMRQGFATQAKGQEKITALLATLIDRDK